MTNTTAVQIKNAKRLRPFDQEDKDFFAEFSNKSIDEKIADLQDSHAMFINQTVDAFKSRFDINDSVAAKTIARLARIALRDIKHYELALMKNLEQIEVTGEWK